MEEKINRDKLKMHTPDLADENSHKLAGMLHNAVTETITGYDEACYDCKDSMP